MAETTKIRVLVVDDSAVVRRILTDILATDPMIELVGTAANGKIGLALIDSLKPDLVTLDIEMPELNGLQTLKKIRETNKTLPVIMFSSLTQRGGIETLEALGLGATDYVTKPTNESSGLNSAKDTIREQVLQKIRYFGGRRKGISTPSGEAITKPTSPIRTNLSSPVSSRVDLVAIGVSTGGPNALAEIFPKLPQNFPVPIVIVQHMPAYFTKVLADRLSSQSKLQVQEGANDIALKSGHAWLAPGGFHMVLQKNNGSVQIKLNEDPPENSCRPAVDPLFASAVKIYGPNMLGVILTGMGKDGFRGCELIRQAGGQILAQDEASSVVWGMPRFVAESGLADKVISLHEIADEIVRRVHVGRVCTQGFPS